MPHYRMPFLVARLQLTPDQLRLISDYQFISAKSVFLRMRDKQRLMLGKEKLHVLGYPCWGPGAQAARVAARLRVFPSGCECLICLITSS